MCNQADRHGVFAAGRGRQEAVDAAVLVALYAFQAQAGEFVGQTVRKKQLAGGRGGLGAVLVRGRFKTDVF